LEEKAWNKKSGGKNSGNCGEVYGAIIKSICVELGLKLLLIFSNQKNGFAESFKRPFSLFFFQARPGAYKGDDSWVKPTIFAIKKCLDSDKISPADPDCEFCQYRKLIKREEK